MNENRILIEFKANGAPYYNTDSKYRILRSGKGDDGRLFLERVEKDLMEAPKWEQVPYKDLLGPGVFEDNVRWRKLWAKVAVQVKWGGTILDTRNETSLPATYRGVIHVYSSRNDHAPDDDNQDAYVVVKRRGSDFVSEVETLERLPEGRQDDLFLGALYAMIRKEQEDSEAPDGA